MTFRLDYADLALVRQVFDRQAQHLQQISDYVSTHCGLTDVSGVVMALMRPQYEAGRDNAITGFAQGRTIAETCSELVATTETEYVAADRAAWERSSRRLADLGVEAPPWQDPRSGATLAPARCVQVATDEPDAAGGGGLDLTKGAKQTWEVLSDERARWLTPDDADWLKPRGTGVLERVEDVTKWGTTGQWTSSVLPDAPDSGTDAYRATSRRFRDGFTSGQALASEQGLDGGSNLGPRSVWLNAQESRAVRGVVGVVTDGYGAYTSVVGAVGAVGDAADAVETAAQVGRTADAPANTASWAWANGTTGNGDDW